ncbi:GPW/gp25 family protein [Candidatus Pelagibacter bacterium]|nr:GPW/gp25 family protein [Candidatus Pelagibacter bacterium]
MSRNARSAQEFFDQLSPFADIAYGPNINSPIDQDDDFTDPMEQIKQNFRTLLLTRSGEKLGDPQFGIGIQNYVFEMNTIETQAQINSKIRSQTNIYMSYITIREISLQRFENNENGLYIAITYYVPQINQQDQIVVDFPENR